jgi:cobalt-zinc-cadmium efflux system outer membrane protein
MFMALLLAAAACATTAPREAVPPGALAPPPAAPPPPPADRGAASAPGPILTLDEAVDLALANNPALAQAAWTVEVGGARVVQAGLWPNPQAGLTIEDVGGTGTKSGAEQAETTLRLAQRFEVGGQRAARVDAATRGRDLSAWDVAGARLDVVAATAQAFYDVLGAQERLALADQAVALGEQVVASVSRLVEAGREPIAETTRAEVALAAARIDRAQVQRDLATARERLAAQWGADGSAIERVDGRLADGRTPPSGSALEARLTENPDLARWATELAEREAHVTLEERRAIPDVTLEAGYRRFEDTSDSGFVFGVFVPLPVLDRNQGGIAAAQHELAAAREAQRVAQVRARAALREAQAELVTAHDEVAALRDTILPNATRVFDSVKNGYAEGRYRYLDVVDTQRTLVATRERLVRALTDYR